MPYSLTGTIEHQHDQADAALWRIIELKRQLLAQVDHCRRHHMDGEALDSYEAAAEESFDDLWHDEWRRNLEVYPAINFPEHIPSFQQLREGRFKGVRVEKTVSDLLFAALKPSNPAQQLRNLNALAGE